MSNEDNQESHGLSRRGLLKGVSALAAISAIGVELNVGKEGLETIDAIYYPIYERHDKRMLRARIPKGIDFYFNEPVTHVNSPDLNIDPEWQAKMAVASWTENPNDLLARFSQEHTGIILGDTEISKNPDEFILVQGYSAIVNIIAGVFTSVVAGKKILEKISPSSKNTEIPSQNSTDISRRSFLVDYSKKVAKTALFMKGIGTLAHQAAVELNPNEERAITRILARIDGFISNTDPTALGIFMRDAMMALQLITVAKYNGEDTRLKPKIAFQIGAGHAGIEDFLRLGEESIVRIIASYPQPVLDYLLERNEGVDGFASVGIVHLPEDYHPTDRRDNPPRTSEFKRVVIKNEKLATALGNRVT